MRIRSVVIMVVSGVWILAAATACAGQAPNDRDPAERPKTPAPPGNTDPGKYVEEPTKTMEPAEPEPVVSPATHPSGKKMDTTGLRKVLARLPKGTRHEFLMLPMRDGVKLATDLLLPPEGNGPWPVVLLRTQYSRWDGRGANKMGDAPFVMVLQNVRGSWGSEGKGTFDPIDFRVDCNDGYDTIEWLAARPWSNGRVGMWGPSGHGVAAINAMWSLAPHLTAIDVNVTMDNAYLYIAYHDGVRRYLHSWLAQRGMSTKAGEWPRPTTVAYDPQTYFDFIKEKAARNRTFYRNNGGWFDIFNEAALDHFTALAPHGRAYVQISAGGHGKIFGDLEFKARNRPPAEALRNDRSLKDLLTKDLPAEPKSMLLYFLMGDGKDAAAPGNVWMTSEKWPVDHTPTSYYLRPDGLLTLDAPTDKSAGLSYRYDPRDPVPMLGGHHQVSNSRKPNIGPMDQRPNAGRKDILRFRTEPLAEPVGITGKVRLELHASSDCPDTMFTAKLVDVYPDGYEAIIREGAVLARHWQGWNKPAPIEAGKVYKLSMDLWSTALVFNKGHRIAVFVTSSSDPAYEVHPNTYEPVGSIEQARVATNTVHLSADHASRLILPVVAKETYIDVGG